MPKRAGIIFGTFVAIVVAVIVAPTVIDFSRTDTDEHGRIPMPGEQVLELPEGDVGVYYGERRRMPARRRGDTLVPDALPVPRLDVRAVKTDDGAEADLRTWFVDGIQVGSGGRTTRQFGVLEVPAKGDYRVTVRRRERIEYPDPVLSLGHDSSEETEWGPSEWLLENIVLVIMAGLGVVLVATIAPMYMGRTRQPR